MELVAVANGGSNSPSLRTNKINFIHIYNDDSDAVIKHTDDMQFSLLLTNRRPRHSYLGCIKE